MQPQHDSNMTFPRERAGFRLVEAFHWVQLPYFQFFGEALTGDYKTRQKGWARI
jgi:hypothetical protein